MEAFTVIFDIGKTNKKLIVFNEKYQHIYSDAKRFDEIEDEDGFPAENINALLEWIAQRLTWVRKNYNIKFVNFSTYGASLLYLNEDDTLLTPLYNYIKSYPEDLMTLFQEKHGEEELSCATASPSEGMLNAGLQIFRLKQTNEDIYDKIKWIFHFPQYLSYKYTQTAISNFPSIGCHTTLWDYKKERYHEWVIQEGIETKLPTICDARTCFEKEIDGNIVTFGQGIHDSSAALIPYLMISDDKFLLISTGTWSVSLNPFCTKALKQEELRENCLNYMTLDGQAVRASKLFLGKEHEEQVELLNEYFEVNNDFYQSVLFSEQIYNQLVDKGNRYFKLRYIKGLKRLQLQELKTLANFEIAYHQLMIELMEWQIESAKRAIGDTPIDTIYIEGGFSANQLYIQILMRQLGMANYYTSEMAEGSALGACLAVHLDSIHTENLKTQLGLKRHEI